MEQSILFMITAISALQIFTITSSAEKNGLMLEVDTADFVESINYEVDGAGNVMRTWNLADIISAAMIAGGDDPTEFVVPTAPAPNDWFHENGATYNRADDSLIIFEPGKFSNLPRL